MSSNNDTDSNGSDSNDNSSNGSEQQIENSNTNLIINYLPQHLTDEQFRALFERFGDIRSAKVVRNKSTGYSYGFGFVDYLSGEHANKAINSLNGHIIGDKRIKVAFARASGDAIKKANLYVKNLPANYSETDIKRLFSRFGNIIQCKVVGNRGVAFVRYDLHVQAMAAINAMNGILLDGADDELVVQFAIDKSQTLQGCNLYLQDIGQSLDTKDKEISQSNNVFNNSNNNNRLLSPVSSVSNKTDEIKQNISGGDVALNLSSIPSDKLLAVLQNFGDNCQFCAKNISEHVHYITSCKLIIDPSIELPKLVDTKCYACGQTQNHLKLCSRCKTATYCDVRCQLNDYAKHHLVCSADSNVFNEKTDEIDYIAALGTRHINLYEKMEALVLHQHNDDKSIFYIAGDANSLTDMMSKCVTVSKTFKNTVKPKTGQIYLIKHSDNTWYRALILNTNNDTAVAFFIDFGNTETITTEFIMALPNELNVSSLPGIAVKCVVNPSQKNLKDIHNKIENACDGTYLLNIAAVNKENNAFIVNVY